MDRRDAYYQFYIFNKFFFFYNNLLKPLLEIELYDKIDIYNIPITNPIINPNTNPNIKLIDINILHFSLKLNKFSKFQSIKRYLYNQSRELTFTKLFIIFNEYDKILEEIIYINNNFYYLYQIKDKFKNFNKQLILSLDLLLNTYNNDINVYNYIILFKNILSKL